MKITVGCDTKLRSLTNITDVSGKPVASIFRAESEYEGNRSLRRRLRSVTTQNRFPRNEPKK